MSDNRGKRIKQVRKLARLSQEEFAQHLGVTRGAVGNWERNAGGIEMTHLQNIRSKFGVSLDWLISATGDVPVAVLDPDQVAAGDVRAPQPAADGYLIDMENETEGLQRAFKALAGRGRCEFWRLTSAALDGYGYLPGDRVIVDLDRQPGQGSIVLAVKRYPGQDELAIFRVYEPPYLLALPTRPPALAPDYIDNRVIMVKGVVTGQLRFPG